MNQNENENLEEIGKTDSLELLNRLKSEVFDGDNEALAVAMGRPSSEIAAWFSGDEVIDDDAEMKIHGIAKERLSAE